MYLQRVCTDNYRGEMKKETTNSSLPEINTEIETFWKL